MRTAVWLIALAFSSATGERRMPAELTGGHAPVSDSDSVRAAMAARLVLGASVSGSPARWQFHDDTAAPVQLNETEFLHALARMPKPVYCVAAMVDSTTASVSCEPPSESLRAHIALRSRELERGEGFFEDFAPMLAWRGRLQVRLRGQGAELALTFAEWKCFVESFDIGGASTLGIRLPELTERAESGVIIVQAGRVEEYRGPIPPA